MMERRLLLSSGKLDTFFGGGGIAAGAFPGGASASISDVQALPDGRLLAVGKVDDFGGPHLFVARFSVNGTPDATFAPATSTNPAGVVLTSLLGGGAGTKLCILDSGKFLVASGSSLHRFSTDGSIDPKFTADAPSTFKYGWNTLSIDVQDDDMIVLGGRYKMTAAHSGHFAVARFRTNGTKDKTFGVGGVADELQGSNSAACAVRVMSDGTILAAGFRDRGYLTDLDEYHTQDSICYKFKSDGTLDDRYGASGQALATGRFYTGAQMNAAIGSDGSAVITAAGDTCTFFRFDPTGQLDDNFGTNGRAGVPSLSNIGEPKIMLQSDGAAVTIFSQYPNASDVPTIYKVMRLTAQGQLEASFGTRGFTTISFKSNPSVLNALTFANDGSILVCGGGQVTDTIESVPTSRKMILARLWRDEAPAAQLSAPDITASGSASYRFKVTLRDDVAINVKSIDSSDFRVYLPNGTYVKPTIMSISSQQNGALVGINFKIAPPGGSWGFEDWGVYSVRLLNGHVCDTSRHYATGRTIGTFRVVIYDVSWAASAPSASTRKIDDPSESDLRGVLS